MIDTCILSGEMKIVVHHIYELQKGMRSMVLCTLEKKDETFALQRLEKLGIPYYIHTINSKRMNLFFGKKECICVIHTICNRPLNELSPEEDFILGTLLGYDICQQCNRYTQRKILKKTA